MNTEILDSKRGLVTFGPFSEPMNFFIISKVDLSLWTLKYCSTEDFVLNRIALKIFQTTLRSLSMVNKCTALIYARNSDLYLLLRCSKFSTSYNKALIQKYFFID